MTLSTEQQEYLLLKFKDDRLAAHKYLFAHRHKDEDPAFHQEMLELLYSNHPLVAMMAFRGGGKSTYIEEYALLTALFRDSVFVLLVGPKWESACERLAPIRSELETNDMIIELFGDQKASPWTMGELVLANGVKIQAVGAGQSMRGKKHNDERPDMALIDDLEDEENIRTEESRDRTERWLTGTLLPALHPTGRKVRFVGTAIHPKSLIIKKCNDPLWKSRVFPILNIDPETGEEKSAWPSRFPLEWVKDQEKQYLNAGRYLEFQQEYMCRAEDISGKPFQARMIKVEPAPRVNLPVWMFVDPARTVNRRSARTGYAAWSWLGNRLYVHEAEGHFHKPDEIIAKTREWNDRFNPVHIGVEADGLEEFLMQPFRTDMMRNGSMPIIPVHAPRDKQRFIEGLQPFYMAGDVIHTKHLIDLESELLQFPTGRIDVPNALAYSLRMRAGKPVYEDFTDKHIAPVLEVDKRHPRFLCVSARPSMTGGVLAQYIDGVIKIYRSWVYNEPALECFPQLLVEARLAAGEVKVVMPYEQGDQYINYGLPAAIRKGYIQPIRGAQAAKTEGIIRKWLQKQVRGEVAVLVNQDSRWVINGLAGGYARRLDKNGHLSDYPTDDQYRLVMEAVECWVGYFDSMYSDGDTRNDVRYAVTKDGKQYISLR